MTSNLRLYVAIFYHFSDLSISSIECPGLGSKEEFSCQMGYENNMK